MSDAPDPLGKRALYWAPAERHEDGPRNADETYVAGKRALFSDAGTAPSTATSTAPSTATSAPGTFARVPGAARALSGRSGHPSNRRAHDDRPARETNEGLDGGRPDDLERPVGSGMFGSLTLHCSSCRVRSHVDLVEYIVLHLPLWFWRPGRGYTRFMSCPACHRRTWVSASWTGWSR